MNEIYNTGFPFKRIDSCALVSLRKRKANARETELVEPHANVSFVVSPCNIQPTTTKRQRCRTVHFDFQKNQIFTPQRYEGEQEDTWLLPDEYRRIRESNKQTIYALKGTEGCASELDTDKYCLRGLESHIAYYLFNDRKSRTRDLICQVLSEQQRQRKIFGFSNARLLKIVSLALSKDHTILALKRANQDFLCVEQQQVR